MNIKKIKEKARIYMYYQALFGRLRDIKADIAQIDASDEMFAQKNADEITQHEVSESLYRIAYRAILEKEAAKIRAITETNENPV